MKLETAILAAGCFWCVEGQFLQLKGVQSVESGYIGGQTVSPTYEEVCTGQTGHAEAVRITYNAEVIDYATVLRLFFMAHDPTQLNRQGNDVGTQYRSAIFPVSETQKRAALDMIRFLNAQPEIGGAIVTTIEEGYTFYKAEAYHDNYFEKNPANPYCQAVVQHKVKKFVENLEAEDLLKRD